MTHRCLACGGALGLPFFEIDDLPLVDSFRRTQDEARKVSRYSIALCQCESCMTIQIASPPDTSDIYRNYIYESSSSPDLLQHFDNYAKLIKSISKDNESPILEIGANDGLLLKQLSKLGFTKLVGVDPSPQTKNLEIENAEIINDFFDRNSAEKLKNSNFQFIIANNCFSHIPELCEKLVLCRDLLSTTGILIVEVQSTLDLVESAIFDYIYHEHYFYHSSLSFNNLAAASGLELFDVQRHDTKGGTYRFFLGHRGRHRVEKSVAHWQFRENVARIHSPDTWALLTSYLAIMRSNLTKLLDRATGPIAAYGACATGTVFMKHMEIEDKISFIVDDNLSRQGLYSPGTGIPVVAPSHCGSASMCVILAWRHSKYIAPKLKGVSVPFIIPHPAAGNALPIA